MSKNSKEDEIMDKKNMKEINIIKTYIYSPGTDNINLL